MNCGTTAAGTSADGDGAETDAASGDVDDAGVLETSGVAAGVLSGSEVGCTVSFALSGAGVGALTDVTNAGPIRSSSPSSEPLIFR